MMMKRPKPLPRTGFTLTEILVAMGLFLLALTLILNTFFTIRQNYARTAVRQTLQQDIRRVAEAVAQDLRAALAGTVKIQTVPGDAGPGRSVLEFLRAASSKESKAGGAARVRVRVRYAFSTPLLKRWSVAENGGKTGIPRILTGFLKEFEIVPTKPVTPENPGPEMAFTLRFLGAMAVPGSHLLEYHEELTTVTVRSEGTDGAGFLARDALHAMTGDQLSPTDTTGDSFLRIEDELTLEDAMKMDPKQLQEMKTAQKDNLTQIQAAIDQADSQISGTLPGRGILVALGDETLGKLNLWEKSELGKAGDLASEISKENDPDKLVKKLAEIKKSLAAKEKEFLSRAIPLEKKAEVDRRLNTFPPGKREKILLLALRTKMIDRPIFRRDEIELSKGTITNKSPRAIDKFLQEDIMFKEKHETDEDFAKRTLASKDEKINLSFIYNSVNLGAVMGKGNESWGLKDPPDEYKAFEAIQRMVDIAATKVSLTKGLKVSEKNLQIIEKALAAKQ